MEIDSQKWHDISVETERAYVYPGYEYVISEPKRLNISESTLGGHSHRVETKDGQGIYVAPGWIAIRWKVAEGSPVFTF